MYTSPADIKKALSPAHVPASSSSSSFKSHLPPHLTTPERKISNPELPLARGPVQQFNSLPRNAHQLLPDYVVVPDSEALNKLDTLKRQSKGMLVRSESPLGGRGGGSTNSLVDSNECLYSDPRETSPAHSPAPSPSHSPAKKLSQSSLTSSHAPAPPPPVPPREKLYDHLTPRTIRRKLQENGIDISDASSIYSLAENIPGRSSPVIDVGTPQLGMYDMVEEGGASLYSLAGEAEVSDVNSYPRNREAESAPPTMPVYSYTTVSGREDTPPEALYAEPTIPRTWSPSPSPERGVASSRSPKPGNILNTTKQPIRVGTVRDKSPSLRQAPPVPRRGTSPNLIKHVVPDEENPSLIYAVPTKPPQTKTSPKVSHTFHEATPPSDVAPDEENPSLVYAIPTKPRTSPKVSHTFHKATPPSREYEEEEEDDEDAPPPLPERNYCWSDIEVSINIASLILIVCVVDLIVSLCMHHSTACKSISILQLLDIAYYSSCYPSIQLLIK